MDDALKALVSRDQNSIHLGFGVRTDGDQSGKGSVFCKSWWVDVMANAFQDPDLRAVHTAPAGWKQAELTQVYMYTWSLPVQVG